MGSEMCIRDRKGCESQGTMRKRVVLGAFRARLSILCQTSRDCISYQSRPPEETCGSQSLALLRESVSLVITAQASQDARSPGACGQVPQTKEATHSDAHLHLCLPKEDKMLRDVKSYATLVVVVCSCGVVHQGMPKHVWKESSRA